jgi:hypothetical protein
MQGDNLTVPCDRLRTRSFRKLTIVVDLRWLLICQRPMLFDEVKYPSTRKGQSRHQKRVSSESGPAIAFLFEKTSVATISKIYRRMAYFDPFLGEK